MIGFALSDHGSYNVFWHSNIVEINNVFRSEFLRDWIGFDISQ